MKKLQAFILALLMISGMSGCANIGRIEPLKRARDISEAEVIRDMAVRPVFPTGKRFIYLMAWNGIPVGRIIASSDGVKKYRGRDVYAVTVVTESNKFLSRIYRVEDTYTSYIDVAGMTSMRYEADRKEGNYRKHVVVEYDFDAREAIYTNLTDGSVKRSAIKDNVQDPVSTLCYFMTLPAEPGEKVHITVNLNEKNYELYGQVGDIDVIRLPGLGSFPAFKLIPYAILKGEVVRKGRGWMYFEAAQRRYPLYGTVWIPFGKVTATLRAIEEV